MSIREYQETVDNWIREHGVRYFDEMTNLAVLMEEVGEYARLMARTYGEQSFKENQKPEDIKLGMADEIADIFFVLTCLANQTEIDMTAAILKNLDKKTARDKDRHKSNDNLR